MVAEDGTPAQGKSDATGAAAMSSRCGADNPLPASGKTVSYDWVLSIHRYIGFNHLSTCLPIDVLFVSSELEKGAESCQTTRTRK